jgi:RNase H-fold protein (predicted Holliday junction resolvase)
VNLLGLDLGTRKLGFAIGDPDSSPKSGVMALPGADEHVFPRTLSVAADTVLSLCKIIRATHAVIEAPIIIGGRSAHTMIALMQLTGAVRAAIYRAGCTVELLVPPQTVRKFWAPRSTPLFRGAA